MPARRGEVPFVAVRVGRSNDPREVLDPARELRVDRATMLGYVVLWEELILEVGDAMTGRVRGYTASHVAAKLGYRGKPAKLIDVLKRAGLLSVQRGTFVHPGWLDSPTGDYARRKADDRESWRLQKLAQRAAAREALLGSNGATTEADVREMSGWTEGGRPPGLHQDGGQKERKDSSGQHPPAPAQSAGELASRRLEWLLEHGENPNNPEGCKRYLGQISETDWPLAQWVLQGCPGGASRSSSRKKRALERPAYQILRSAEWLRFRREWVEKLRADEAPKNGHAKPAAPRVDPEVEREAKRTAAVTNVLACLSDADASDKAKERAKKIFAQTWGPPLPWDPLQDAPPTN